MTDPDGSFDFVLTVVGDEIRVIQHPRNYDALFGDIITTDEEIFEAVRAFDRCRRGIAVPKTSRRTRVESRPK